MIVEKVRKSPRNMINLLEKYGEEAARMIDDGQLHLDFDNRYSSNWNQEIIRLLPLEIPMAITSYKGIIYVHCLDEETVDCNCWRTQEILEMMVERHGDVKAIRELLA